MNYVRFYARPKIVTIIGVFQLVVSSLSILVLLFGTYVRWQLIDALNTTSHPAPLHAISALVLEASVKLVVSGLLIWTANAFLKGRQWARKTLMVLSFATMIYELVEFAVIRQQPLLIIGAVINGLIFATVTFSGDVRLFFDLNERERMTPQE